MRSTASIPSSGTRFSSFAVPTILGELRQHFRDHTWALRAPQPAAGTERADRARPRRPRPLARAPADRRRARQIACAPPRSWSSRPWRSPSRATRSRSTGRGRTDGDEPQQQRGGRDDDGYARAEDRALLVSLLRTLSPQDAEIVLLRFREELTQDAIARRVGVSQMQVSRVLCRSMGRTSTLPINRHVPGVRRGGSHHRGVPSSSGRALTSDEAERAALSIGEGDRGSLARRER